jgi:Spy/CpxP family protein refolding chaperone
MKQNKSMKWVLFISLLLIAPDFAMAQPGKGMKNHDGPPSKNMPDSCRKRCADERLARELSLTDVQKQKLAEIHASHFEQMNALRKADSANFEKSREQRQQVQEKINTEIKQILTDEQKVKFDAFVAERKSKHKGGPEKGCPCK